MQINRVVGEKGQVVIPKDIREYMGLKPNSEIVFEIRDGEVIIKSKNDPKKFVDDFCSVPGKLKKKIDLERLIEKQVEQEYHVR